MDWKYPDVDDTLSKEPRLAWLVPQMCHAALNFLTTVSKFWKFPLEYRGMIGQMSPSSNSSELFFGSGFGRNGLMAAYSHWQSCATVRIFVLVDPSRVLKYAQSQQALTLRSVL
jgi:hypothetical protein